MKRCLLLLLLLMLPLVAPAEDGLTLLVNRDNSARGYADNTITVSAGAAGSLSMSIGDAYGTYFAWSMPVEAGQTVIPWDGLGWNQERITDGWHTLSATLTTDAGDVLQCDTAVHMQRCLNAVVLALPGSSALYQADGADWFCEVRCIRTGGVVAMDVFAADDTETLLGTVKKQISVVGPLKLYWDGQLNREPLPPREYILRYYLTENPAWSHEVCLTIAEGSAPEMPVFVTGEIIPRRGMTDAEIWAIMQQPSVVAALSSQTGHLTIREEKGAGAELGTVHGQSQALAVMRIEGDYAFVGAWNHESGDYVEGWVPLDSLKVATPNSEYGLLVDKREQTMTVYHRGVPIDTIAISTGLMAEKKLIRETSAGAFLTVDRIGSFSSEGYRYDHVIRYDGGNLIHQMGYDADGTKHDFSDHAAVLGSKASHGCIRVSNVPGEGAGINAYWLYTHLPYHTRVIILDDPEERRLQKAAAGAEAGELTVAPVEPPELQAGETELIITIGGDAVIGTREKWWDQEDAFPAFAARYGTGYFFRALQPVFASDDMTLVNLECVLKADKRGEQTDKAYRFRGLPEWAAVLTDGSIEQVSIANNHHVDYGAAGREATKAALDASGVAWSGYGSIHVWEQDGLRIGFGGCRETVYKQDPDVIRRDIAAMKQVDCDVVIYLCHWGVEYDLEHNALQEEMAIAAAAAGADIVVGSHPHVVQGLDSVGSTPVIYSLGNLMFGGTHDMQTFDGMLVQLRLRFREGGYTGVTVELIPVLTSSSAAEGVNDFCPVVAAGEDRRRILNNVQADTPFVLREEMYWAAE